MDLERLREIIDLVAESGVSEIEIEEEGLRIMVRKESPVAAAFPQVVHAAAPSMPPSVQDTTSTEASEPESTATTGSEIRSPIVGTFYASPSPDADSFVSVGQRVSPGDVLCIIEAMKLMNEIESEVSGVIKEVLVDNASPVEFDQPLFIVEPS